MPHMMTIPQEVFDHVLAHVCSESTSDLKTCSLVCRAWLATCRLHLFHTIDLVYPTSRVPPFFTADEDGSARLALDGVAPYIRQVHIKITRNALSTEEFNGLFQILPVLPSLPQLHGLSFECSVWIGTFVDCVPMLSTVTELYINQCLFPSFRSFQHLISCFPGLKKLSIGRNVGGMEDEEAYGSESGDSSESQGSEILEQDAPLPQVAELKELAVLSAGQHILGWFSRFSDELAQLRSLRVYLSPADDEEAFERFSSVHRASITELAIGYHYMLNFPDMDDYFSSRISLASWQSLTRLELDKISLNSLSRWAEPASPSDSPSAISLPFPTPPWYIQLLASLTSPLSYLGISVWFYQPSDLNLFAWRSLNELLTWSVALIGLKELTFRIWENDAIENRGDGWAEGIVRGELGGIREGTKLVATVLRGESRFS